MNKIYPTDLTDTQWQYIQNVLLFEERKRKHDLREIWNAIFYLVKTSCQWRILTKCYPKWVLVYYYFRKWFVFEEFDSLLSHLRGVIRVKLKQNREASTGIIDAPPKVLNGEIIKHQIVLMETRKSKVLNGMSLLIGMGS